jgi:hypothetical protein
MKQIRKLSRTAKLARSHVVYQHHPSGSDFRVCQTPIASLRISRCDDFLQGVRKVDRGHRPRLCGLVCAVAGRKSSVFVPLRLWRIYLAQATTNYWLELPLPTSRMPSASDVTEYATKSTEQSGSDVEKRLASFLRESACSGHRGGDIGRDHDIQHGTTSLKPAYLLGPEAEPIAMPQSLLATLLSQATVRDVRDCASNR